MRRRRFLKAVLGAGVAAVIPIPVPAPPKPLTFGVVGEAIKRTVEKNDLVSVNTVTTLDDIFKRTYGKKFDHAGYWQGADFKLMRENGFTK